MKKFLLPVFIFAGFAQVFSQTTTIPVAENLVTDGIPPIASTIVADVKNYTESRGAGLAAWHPVKREMIISTRFGNVNQLHWVKTPGGDRKQITFFDEPIGNASFEPNNGAYFLFNKDVGGNEFTQIHRYDVQSRKSVLLTDGKRS